ncbi:MAG: pyridoxamine 5'-phosphate oxidase family protein [Campylobacterales bacterium]
MGKRYEKLSDLDKEFIKNQHMFFIASCSGKEVNLSPRGYDCFRVTGDNEAVFLDYAGSGNRTATDINADGEVTVMFCSFGEKPLILRLFCKGELIGRDDVACRSLFENEHLAGMRRFVKLHIYCVEHSCGMSVPFYEFKGDRNTIRDWCKDGAENGKIDEYTTKNATPPDLSGFRTSLHIK